MVGRETSQPGPGHILPPYPSVGLGASEQEKFPTTVTFCTKVSISSPEGMNDQNKRSSARDQNNNKIKIEFVMRHYIENVKSKPGHGRKKFRMGPKQPRPAQGRLLTWACGRARLIAGSGTERHDSTCLVPVLWKVGHARPGTPAVRLIDVTCREAGSRATS